MRTRVSIVHISICLFHKIRKWLPPNSAGSQMGDDSYSAEWGGSRLCPPRPRSPHVPSPHPNLCGKLKNSKRVNNKRNKWLSGQRQQAKQKAFLLRLRGRTREMERWRRRGRERGGWSIHLVRRSISFAWFILSKAPTMQMTHKVEIERLWSRCQEWIYIWLPGGLCVLNHFQLDDTFNIEPLI